MTPTTTYILILLYWGGHGEGALTHVEFADQQACIVAGKKAAAVFDGSMSMTPHTYWVCSPKASTP